MKKIICGTFLSLFIGCSSAENKKDEFLPACPDSPNCYIERVPFKEEKLEIVKNRIITNVTQLKGSMIEDKKEYLKFSFKTKTFKFEDILEVYIDMDKKNIHIRSAAETGWYDFGVNKKRVKKLILLLKD